MKIIACPRHQAWSGIIGMMLALLPSVRSIAATYYVSNSGNDNNSGTSQGQAWATIARVNQSAYSFQAGDQILFQRGGVFRGALIGGSSGNASQSITYGAYGSGAAPVISGSDLVTNWAPYQGNIWVASVPQPVKYVYVGGQRMNLARYPNSGWLRNDNGSTSSLQDAALTQANGYWTGATVVIRSSNWSYDALAVTGFNNHTLSFSGLWGTLGTTDWGYFLCNKLSELDMAGEWYYDAGTSQLYLWAPGNADPNTLTVEAAVRDRGIDIYYNRHHINVNGLKFQHQREAGIWLGTADHINVSNCTFTDLYYAFRTYGTANTYDGNTISRTYATAMMVIDQNSMISNNTLTQIAMVPGLGENSWGYMGIRVIGSGNTVRSNVMDSIGYTAVEVRDDCLVEKNVLRHSLALLNDGGGIAFDNANGLIVRDNIVTDAIGNLDSSAPNFANYEPICHGIYFGNTSIQNTTVQRNTVTNCPGSGIHVDHTMLSTGNQIKDNVLFNNEVQLSISDYSNNNGPGAQPPYFVANFNDVYTGNVLYCLNKDQLCMRQMNVYSATPVDFGTFNNNWYFNPYNELCIYTHNTYNGVKKWYTLERWQTDRNEDPNSHRSPLHLNERTATSELSANLVVNGTFNYNVTGWSGWPTNAQVVQDYTYLDNGALKATLPNANMYPDFFLRNPDQFAMQNGQWYRMRFSLQSNALGEVKAGVKGMTQMSGGNVIYERSYPFSPERREVEFLFQGGLTDQAVLQFVNNYTEPTYWIDNVALHRVATSVNDPLDRQMILINDQATAQDFNLTGCWSDVTGTLHSGSINVQAYRSIVLVKEDDGLCGLSTPVIDGTDPTGGLSWLFPNPVRTNTFVQIHYPGAGPIHVRLFDPKGSLVLDKILNDPTAPLKLPSLPSGIYAAELAGATGRSFTRLMVE